MQHLGPYYETGLQLLRYLRARPHVRNILVEHVFREFNADADGLANLALDSDSVADHADGVVLDYGWHMQAEG
eukprot:12260109-Karenia_brevis.AAC.1